ncbi:Mth938-like domain-containing protein [Ruegeria sp. Ofav3-42]|uniref:Mth938-like domain-containing protein n=1 Tax=Ruegeria sp. Ofav3-42 TaxID=2917759 RepID=UPI001EF543B9|nr:Mth938-like domain-containing protein [Ruegeria sp. Ofav3-42]MCG7521326.1 Mth938-like domain-containing protein [Ruegeria sp. Ofav3-42]
MRLNEITYNNATPVDGYGPGFFRVGGQVFEDAILTGPGGTAGWGGYSDQSPLLALSEHVDVLLIGTGAELAHIPADLRASLEQAGLGVEIMNSPAACRTYNILLSEGRRVALALLPT